MGEEKCPTCGQPDNCGDCTHEPVDRRATAWFLPGLTQVQITNPEPTSGRTLNERGFAVYGTQNDGYGTEMRVAQSSAIEPHAWLFVGPLTEGSDLHLTPDNARWLRARLAEWLTDMGECLDEGDNHCGLPAQWGTSKTHAHVCAGDAGHSLIERHACTCGASWSTMQADPT